MAITNIEKINDYLKIGSARDVCIICTKKISSKQPQDYYDLINKLKGKLENKLVVKLTTSGVDHCICMDCIKEIHDKYIAPKTNNKEGE